MVKHAEDNGVRRLSLQEAKADCNRVATQRTDACRPRAAYIQASNLRHPSIRPQSGLGQNPILTVSPDRALSMLLWPPRETPGQ
ncbi:hypothetical protein V2G26_016308 [Clonostachys chloroleuca]